MVFHEKLQIIMENLFKIKPELQMKYVYQLQL